MGGFFRRGRHTRHRRGRTALVIGACIALLSTAAIAFADGGTLDVQVPDKTGYANDTTDDGAIVEYIGDDNTSFGASGTGTFESFVRVQESPVESGYNTDGTLEFNTKSGTWTHSIKVSEIPVVDCASLDGLVTTAGLCWELFADINEGNGPGQPLIRLTDLEVYFTTNASLTGYPFAGTADQQYDFAGSIRINDVNQGSGRGDLRYLVPIDGITIPSDCAYGSSSCTSYFVLYNKWGDADGVSDPSDGGFEEWKVKRYPFVSVSKTADTTFTRTFEWDIDKTVDPEQWDLFQGDTGTSDWTVEVTKDEGTDSDWAVSGTITIENPSDMVAPIESVEDVVSDLGNITVECGVTFPHNLAVDGTLICTYSSDLPDGTSRTNTATAKLVDGPTFSGDAAVVFGDPTTLVNDTIDVTDTNGQSWDDIADDDSFTYEETFACDDDEGTHDNTATITQTGQSDDATVTVNCHDLDVTKDADTSFTRTWDWDIDKSADETELLLSEGQIHTVNYTVVVSASSTDSEHSVSGEIVIDNPNPVLAALLDDVTDVVSPDIAANVICPSDTIAAGGSMTCTYSADLPDDATRTNTATAALQNHDYDSDEVGTPSGTTDFSGTAGVDFANAVMTEVDECIEVNDSNPAGPQGVEVCADDLDTNGEFEFMYSVDFGANPDADVVLECGENTHPNIADFETNDNAITGDDDHTIIATVECVEGCTLTPGYWKTHNESFHGGAPVDDTWGLLPGGDAEDTIFFHSEQTYFQVLWTAPQGNVYYNLAFHYIAAELNQLNGADIPADVLAAFDEATGLFESYTPTQIAALKGKPSDKVLRQQFIDLAGILGAYNEGITGPGHCSEDGTSAN